MHTLLNQHNQKQQKNNFKHYESRIEPANLQTTIVICLSLTDFGLHFIRVYQLCIILFSRRLTNISPLHPSSKCLLFLSRAVGNSSHYSDFISCLSSWWWFGILQAHPLSSQSLNDTRQKRKMFHSCYSLCAYIYDSFMHLLPNIVCWVSQDVIRKSMHVNIVFVCETVLIDML